MKLVQKDLGTIRPSHLTTIPQSLQVGFVFDVSDICPIELGCIGHLSDRSSDVSDILSEPDSNDRTLGFLYRTMSEIYAYRNTTGILRGTDSVHCLGCRLTVCQGQGSYSSRGRSRVVIVHVTTWFIF